MKYKKKRKDNTVIPYYVDNDNEILFNLAICFYWSACTKPGKLAVMSMCWKIGFASFYYDFLVYEVDLVRSCISGIIDWLGLVYGV